MPTTGDGRYGWLSSCIFGSNCEVLKNHCEVPWIQFSTNAAQKDFPYDTKCEDVYWHRFRQRLHVAIYNYVPYFSNLELFSSEFRVDVGGAQSHGVQFRPTLLKKLATTMLYAGM